MGEKGSTDFIQQIAMQSQLNGIIEVFYIKIVYARCSSLERLNLWDNLDNMFENIHFLWLGERKF